MIAERLESTELGVRHGFFTRRGGVSQGPFASLNCSLSSADDRSSVLQNRDRVALALGGGVLLGATQVHGIEVAVVEQAWATGAGPRADAMVTKYPGLVLGVVTADCAPVLFADAEAGVVGAAHAGWRGAADGVIAATIDAMRRLGATRIAACVGPCIGQVSYEVAMDMREQVLARDPTALRFFADGARAGHWQFDLAGFCAARLREAGAARVDVLSADTCADAERFFSHRRRTLAGGGPIGHQMSAISL